MLLGVLMRRLSEEGDAATALDTLGDIVLFTEVTAAATELDEGAGAYVARAARRFGDQASDEDWLGLVGAMERAADPARAALARILRWALDKDTAGPAGACSCGGHHTAHGAHGRTVP